MTDVDALAREWFVDPSSASKSDYPPVRRHPNSALQRYTTGNVVRPLVGGEHIVQYWGQQVADLVNGQSAAPTDSTLLHAGWTIEDIETTRGDAATKTKTLLSDAKQAGVETYLMFSQHATNMDAIIEYVYDLDSDTAAVDTRYPSAGSAHAKFTVFKTPSAHTALVGSADIWIAARNVNHEVSVELEGPAVQEIQSVFERRWNDPTRDDAFGNLKYPLQHTLWRNIYQDVYLSQPPPTLQTPAAKATASGSVAVQVLETYGISPFLSYSWADWDEGEFTIWAAYLKAIKRAEQYVFVEDQFFIPSGYPPACEKPPRDEVNNYPMQATYDYTDVEREASLFYQLGERLADGVDVIVMTNARIGGSSILGGAPGPLDAVGRHLRSLGSYYLKDKASKRGSGDFMIGVPASQAVHAKLLVVDDEYAAVGSANVNRRSHTNDTEIHVGLVDADGELVPDLRARVWAEHMQLADHSSLLDIATALPRFKQALNDDEGDLQRVPPASIRADPGPPPVEIMSRLSVYDPEAGPAVPE
ncbi:MAG: phospholipase D-like domain-containing protein [Haloarculaceae archaeon]